MTTTIIKKNANLSTAGVRTRECVLPQQDTLKGTSEQKLGSAQRASRRSSNPSYKKATASGGCFTQIMGISKA